MGTAREILLGLLEMFRGAMPEVEFREALSAKEAFRPGARVCVMGAVSKESEQGGEWSGKLAFTVYVPRGRGSADDVLDKMTELAKAGQPLLAGVERGAAALDKASGAVAAGCVFTFLRAGSAGGKKVRYPVEINGERCTAAGWKVSEKESGEGIRAIGESEPFYYKESRRFTVEVQGLDFESPEELEGFTLRLGSQRVMYTGCRWKSLSAEGSGVLSAGGRIEIEGE